LQGCAVLHSVARHTEQLAKVLYRIITLIYNFLLDLTNINRKSGTGAGVTGASFITPMLVMNGAFVIEQSLVKILMQII